MELDPSEIQEAYEFVTKELGRNARYDTFEKRIEPTYQRLTEAAKNRNTITYSELANHANTDNRRYLSKLLDGIGYIEERRGNPPTTVIVVHAEDGLPADDFLKLLDTLKMRDRYETSTESELIDVIMAEVFSHYQI